MLRDRSRERSQRRRLPSRSRSGSRDRSHPERGVSETTRRLQGTRLEDQRGGEGSPPSTSQGRRPGDNLAEFRSVLKKQQATFVKP